ncbi:hypothetical protein CIRG_06474 [Coccidioides immitis RMSCC 2394]|uniref:Uncharacterized protein n=1 Tax=Coccidioides immitis RMSCC 2394 TaxID=404692 RepID=A0A0J6YIN5_COCIT|nr:hypothetical protein CIRG_06474 [Coccidioides immitis RMSCC 2394]
MRYLPTLKMHTGAFEASRGKVVERSIRSMNQGFLHAVYGLTLIRETVDPETCPKGMLIGGM